MRAFFDWLDTPGLTGDLLLLAGIGGLVLVAWLCARKWGDDRMAREEIDRWDWF